MSRNDTAMDFESEEGRLDAVVNVPSSYHYVDNTTRGEGVMINGPLCVSGDWDGVPSSYHYVDNTTRGEGVMINGPLYVSGDWDGTTLPPQFELWLQCLGILIRGNVSDRKLRILPMRTWTLTDGQHELPRQTHYNPVSMAGAMFNCSLDSDEGIFAPGVWRETGPDGGMIIPWVVNSGWYGWKSGFATWGYFDVDEKGPRANMPLRNLGRKLDTDTSALHKTLCAACGSLPLAFLAKDAEHRYNRPGRVVACDSSATHLPCQLCGWISASCKHLGFEVDTEELLVFSMPSPSFVQRTNNQLAQLTKDLEVKTSSGLRNAIPGADLRHTCCRVLPDRRTEPFLSLLGRCLAVCDKHTHPISYSAALPTRILDLGDPDGLAHYDDDLRLHISTKDQRDSYVALSRRWGHQSIFCTKAATLGDRCNKISFVDLPKTFQDAVHITRGLGIRFLWIDSLSIVQDDPADWKRESARMEKVFHGAYCTIAATSAKNANEGFLHRNNPEVISITAGDGNLLHLMASGTDFQRDVTEGLLNTRAWVLQQRALSHRILHFTDTQTYLKCESGIMDETSQTYQTSVDAISCSIFPATQEDLRSPKDLQASLFREIYRKYTMLDITVEADRPTAILGTESELALFYNSPSVYGVLTRRDLFGKALMWHRQSNVRMAKIESLQGRVPSWSWMSCTGSITYFNIPCLDENSVIWMTDFELALLGGPRSISDRTARFVLTAPLMRIQENCRVEKEDDSSMGSVCTINDDSGVAGWISYDGEDVLSMHPGQGLGFVRITQFAGTGPRASQTFVGGLIVQPISTTRPIVQPFSTTQPIAKAYCRLGLGVLSSNCLAVRHDTTICVL